ncbi:hypothetical protein XBKB1_3560012 [Xenorhabdus bovienii str. kraussei Becker Underwood]|uniref:Uncharacterized protein n=1 Tax=Xenorhabdus bovienii str. kraussei Becker Underwood TaxID=1398204 RepID=A0A077PWJ0_XENBV|nr:hypothetical protein XBKB1_3560012 [Xenorhabdus bovienii str. kraussei Becker Underwood]
MVRVGKGSSAEVSISGVDDEEKKQYCSNWGTSIWFCRINKESTSEDKVIDFYSAN